MLQEMLSKPFIDTDKIIQDCLDQAEEGNVLDLFKETLPSLFSKEYILTSDEKIKAYSKQMFLINKILSFEEDTVLLVYYLQRGNITDPKDHYDFLFNMIPKQAKRYIKYIKSENGKIENLEEVKEAFKCSTKKALEYLKLLSDADLAIVKQKIFKGKT